MPQSDRGSHGKNPASGPAAKFDVIWTRPERSERSRKPPLTRERIVQAALELADERGLEGLSTRAIAERLGTGPTSMYWHVPTTADLYELISDAAIGEIPLAPRRGGKDWRAAMRKLGLATFEMYARHPWLAMLGIQPGIGPRTRRYGEYAMQVLSDAGVAPEKAIASTAVINNYIFGFALRHAAWEETKGRYGLHEDFDERFEEFVTEAAEQDPQMEMYLRTRARLAGREEFLFGLDCVLDGIGRRAVDRGRGR